ncbi:neutral zinc metallopeptidase [Streptosporangium sp. NPDC023963]|uniref:neutral zinc metallopeptidase n=1 Tax=Streptosporangium sp. NPDC023963 TaxID=3155608 RepID=UPI00341793B4
MTGLSPASASASRTIAPSASQQVAPVTGTTSGTTTSPGSAALAAPAASAGKQAPPRGRAAATASPLYRTGTLPTMRCQAGQIRAGSAASYRTFVTKLIRCLNLAWKTQFRKTNLPFSHPKLRFSTVKVSTPCGRWPTSAGGMYCSSNRTIYIGVTRDVLKNAFVANHAQFIAHEYGHHVQHLAGIVNYYSNSIWRASASTKLAFSRRLELQADCLASAFLRQAADDLPLEEAQWEAMVSWVSANGHKNWPKNDHGKGRSQAYWMERGFNAGSPSGCNTWTAPTGRVA